MDFFILKREVQIEAKIKCGKLRINIAENTKYKFSFNGKKNKKFFIFFAKRISRKTKARWRRIKIGKQKIQV